MQNTVRYSDNHFGDRLEVLLATVLAVAGLVVVAIWLVRFGQLLHQFKGSVIPAILKLRGGAPSLLLPNSNQTSLSVLRIRRPGMMRQCLLWCVRFTRAIPD
jgi:hypothetical protein